MTTPSPITIRGEGSAKTYLGAYRIPRHNNSGRFGKTHLIVKIIDDEVITLCGANYTGGIYVSNFDVYGRDRTCRLCARIALL